MRLELALRSAIRPGGRSLAIAPKNISLPRQNSFRQPLGYPRWQPSLVEWIGSSVSHGGRFLGARLGCHSRQDTAFLGCPCISRARLPVLSPNQPDFPRREKSSDSITGGLDDGVEFFSQALRWRTTSARKQFFFWKGLSLARSSAAPPPPKPRTCLSQAPIKRGVCASPPRHANSIKIKKQR
jgi:hypothetical protein